MGNSFVAKWSMSTRSEFALGAMPTEPVAKNLWLQHAAGFVLFRDVGGYAKSRIDSSLPPDARAAAEKAVDDALYGLMMVADGVSGRLHNDDHLLEVGVVVSLLDAESYTVLDRLDLLDGDGACMGYHMWKENDFGQYPVAIPRSD
jgi:hypothetical protein